MIQAGLNTNFPLKSAKKLFFRVGVADCVWWASKSLSRKVMTSLTYFVHLAESASCNESNGNHKPYIRYGRSAEQELLGTEFFYCVAELGGFFEFEFFGGFTHVGFEVVDVDI